MDHVKVLYKKWLEMGSVDTYQHMRCCHECNALEWCELLKSSFHCFLSQKLKFYGYKSIPLIARRKCKEI